MARSRLNPSEWDGRCVHSESTLHQLSPFLGKMKSTMANELVNTYSEEGNLVLDPFSGSGTVPLEASFLGRNVIGIDRNPYSVLLSKAKLNPPSTEEQAMERAESYLEYIDPTDPTQVSDIPDWVKKFFHPKTLNSLSQLAPRLRRNNEYFLLACLLGILHHQRPGFLSYPASNLKPYLRDEKFPRADYPEKYEYREIRPRLISKIERAFRRFPGFSDSQTRKVYNGDTLEQMNKNINDDSVDAIITSPPYMNKLDYGRDNRLRLYFAGVDDYRELDGSPGSRKQYEEFLDGFLTEATRVIKPGGTITFVLGESKRSGSAVDTSEVLTSLLDDPKYGLTISEAIQDKVPIREINSMSSKTETILSLEWGG